MAKWMLDTHRSEAAGRGVLTAISLFTGVGGFDLGLHRAGIEPLIFCESDAWKRTILAHHWPEVPIHDDVQTLCDRLHSDRERLDGAERSRAADPSGRRPAEHRADGRVDIVHGGFPCQDVSVAGKRAGLAGARTGLFWSALDVIDAVRPRCVLLENVPGLLSSNAGRDFGVVLGEVADRGYGVAYRVLDAQHFGVPQRRRRVFLCAIAGDDPRAAAERAGEVLALRESVRWDPAPCYEAGPASAARAVHSAGVNGGESLARRVADTLTSGGYRDGARPGRTYSMDSNLVPVALDAEFSNGAEMGGDVMHPLVRHSTAAVAYPTHEVSPTLTGSGGGQNQFSDASQQAYVVAFRKSRRAQSTEDAETWVDDGRANTINRFDVGDVRSTHAVVEVYQCHGSNVGPLGALRKGNGNTAGGVPFTPVESMVRRLTPRECERLMGWPDDWTAPEGVKAPDARRYAGCGDGVASPVAEWIGHRVARVLGEEQSDG